LTFTQEFCFKTDGIDDRRNAHRELTAEQAAARLNPEDTLGMPLRARPAPPFMRALGVARTDGPSRRRRAAGSPAPNCSPVPAVGYILRFYGPASGSWGDMGVDIEFTPADFRPFGPLLEAQGPAVMTTVANPARRRRLVLPVTARGRHDRRTAPRGAPTGPAAGRRGLRRLPSTFGLGEQYTPTRCT